MPQPDPDQCALDENGQLKDAKDILFFNSPSDNNPIPLPPLDGEAPTDDGARHGRPQRNKNAGLQDILAAERLNEWGKLDRKHRQPKKRLKRDAKRVKLMDGLSEPDLEDDHEYQTDISDSTTEANDASEDGISNGELADMLPSKTVFGNVRRTQAKKRKRSEKRPGDTLQPSQVTSHSITPTSSFTMDGSSKESKQASNLIYLFYKVLHSAPQGIKAEEGDKFYQSYHGRMKILRVTKKMRSSLNGLIGNLRTCSPDMFKFYCYLKDRPPHVPLSLEEKRIASGEIELTPAKLGKFIQCQDAHQQSLKEAFARQQEKAIEPWNQERFEELLTRWIVASDQPFEEVEKPELVDVLVYVHRSLPSLKIPSRFTVKRRVMKMGAEGVQGMKELFAKINGKMAISLDGWTSSNNYGFLAIIAHYIHPVTGELEESLIDFRELLRRHTGENLADAVWDSLGTFGIQGKTIAFMCDNASNMDTFVDGIVSHAEKVQITIKADWARLRCMPHTIHLAALKILEAIGAKKHSDITKPDSPGINYQDSVSMPLSEEADNDAATQEGDDEIDLTHEDDASIVPDFILPAVDKEILQLRKIIRAVRSSPQRKARWLELVSDELRKKNPDAPSYPPALMLILDVATRWSSTHQMMRRALQYEAEINNFVTLHTNRDLRDLELSEDEWTSIRLVAGWLERFRDATTQMSATHQPMLSYTHAIFRGLQEHLRESLHNLPAGIDLCIRNGLLAAHHKLSEYYYRFDQSPFYIWAALLDPRITYEGLKLDFSNDPILLADLEKSKSLLCEFYKNNYAASPAPSEDINNVHPKSSHTSDFTARYESIIPDVIDKLEEYFKIKRKDFKKCNPLRWWRTQQEDWPNLYRLACDILCIPGSAVAVERIFSSGRDTISIRCARLQPETIRTLMVLKHHLRRMHKGKVIHIE